MGNGRADTSDAGCRPLFKREQCGQCLTMYGVFQNQPELLPIFQQRGMMFTPGPPIMRGICDRPSYKGRIESSQITRICRAVNYAVRSDQPIASPVRAPCIFCRQGSRLRIGGERSCSLCELHLSLRHETQMELFRSAALLFQIPHCRVVDQPARLCKPGAVAGAIPRVLLRIPLQCLSLIHI